MKKKTFLILLIIQFILLGACRHTPVNYLTEDPSVREARMAWWNEARFGMFIHWGLYAIPAGEWEGETNHAEWIRTTAQIPLETYDKFVHEFNPVNYNPEEWVRIAKKAGMKYIVITSKHHDGFCLFDSRHTDFDVMSTPYGNDLLEPLAEACRREGIRICWYHSIMDWHHPDYLPRRAWEKDRSADGADFDRYVAHLKAQLAELVTNYGDIGVLWFDGEWEDTWTNEYGRDLYNYVRNLQPDIIINNRVDVGRSGMAGMTRQGAYAGDFGTPEQEIPATGIPGAYWETCMTMNNHWGYNKYDDHWKSPADLIRKLSDIASKGGNFLLNVGPRADGSFPDESIDILGVMGDWMAINGQAIYGTSASPFRHLDFGRCTQVQGGDHSRLYFHVFEWPEDGILRVPGIYNTPLKAFVLADPGQQERLVSRVEDALEIHLPENPSDPYVSVVVLDIEGRPDISNPPLITSKTRIFIDTLSLHISTDRANTVIRYTLDGTVPGMDAQVAEGPVTLDRSAIVVARCFRDGIPVSDTIAYRIEKVSPTPATGPDDTGTGLIARYYEGTWDSLPDFEGLVPLKKIVTNGFNREARLNDDHYAFSFDGYIDIPTTGIYTFYTDSDDGSRLYIDDRLVVDNDGLHGMTEAEGVVALERGLHKIRVTHFEKTGGDDLRVYYEGPGFERKAVPAGSLFHDSKVNQGELVR